MNRLLRNVELVSLGIDSSGYASLRIRDLDSGDVFTVPGGYVALVESATPDEPGAREGGNDLRDDLAQVIGDIRSGDTPTEIADAIVSKLFRPPAGPTPGCLWLRGCDQPQTADRTGFCTYHDARVNTPLPAAAPAPTGGT